MSKASKFLIEKYERYISNVEWHINTNKPTGEKLAVVQKQLECYREILQDLIKFKL